MSHRTSHFKLLASWLIFICSLVALSGEEHWSIRPLTLPQLPQPKTTGWAHSPIDLFILSKLEGKGMLPSPPADKRTLLRRVYFDLIGLPPTPEEMQAFLADPSPDAYDRVVDHLLASPRYGERWARHWIDLVHFAETHGHDQDRIRTNAWPYRDYLIESFNRDKPYSQFIQEQLAGDVLFPNDPQATVALGFIAAGPWDESSLRDIREETVDRQIARYIDRDDMITTAMSTFTSTTAHCARCHNHKFDPISQEDYYSLQAVFAGVDRANRPYDLDPQLHHTRHALLKKRAALQRKDPTLLLSLRHASFQNELVAWERSIAQKSIIWTPFDPVSFVSSNGATLTKQADGSILSGGKRPDKDIYNVVVETPLKQITALRLELLTDESLPQNGPGRQDNGNFHLSEFEINSGPAPQNGGGNPVSLKRAFADFEQVEWTIQHSIDGQEKTAWGIFPQVGKLHQAIFELKEPLANANGIRLGFHFRQLHGGGHLIGRFRLSAASSGLPDNFIVFPDLISRLLAVPRSQRTDEQNQELAVYYLQQKIERDLASLPPPRMIYAAASDFIPDGGLIPAKNPRPIHLLKRGDINRPSKPALPGALSCVQMLPARFEISDLEDEGLRRAALARWIAAPENPLTWRSIVNRIWQYHFSRGIVDTPNDLGRMGGQPSHPELLDWLAAHFRDSGGLLKPLHRMILLTATYQQSSKHHSIYARLDADNRSLWRMNRSRLDAESIRDAILQITGQIDLTMGGPSFKNFALSPGIHVTPKVDYAQFDLDHPPATTRRSIYRFLFRTLPDPFMDSLDCPDGSQLTPTRATSFTALQALTLLNNQFMLRQSEHFAARLQQLRSNSQDQIRAAFELTVGRPPSRNELSDATDYLRKHGLANLARVLFNSNEFVFVH